MYLWALDSAYIEILVSESVINRYDSTALPSRMKERKFIKKSPIKLKYMKKIGLLVILSTLLYSYANHKTINGVTYRPYGLLNQGSCKNDSVYYEISGWACFSGIVFSECMFIPTIYTFGYNL